jgi:hypothetical protein
MVSARTCASRIRYFCVHALIWECCFIGTAGSTSHVFLSRDPAGFPSLTWLCIAPQPTDSCGFDCVATGLRPACAFLGCLTAAQLAWMRLNNACRSTIVNIVFTGKLLTCRHHEPWTEQQFSNTRDGSSQFAWSSAQVCGLFKIWFPVTITASVV